MLARSLIRDVAAAGDEGDAITSASTAAQATRNTLAVNTLGGGEIGIAQREPYIGEAVEREFDLAFDDGAIGDAADSRHAAGDAGSGAFGLEAVDGDRALRHRIDVAVGAEQRRDEEGAAL